MTVNSPSRDIKRKKIKKKHGLLGNAWKRLPSYKSPKRKRRGPEMIPYYWFKDLLHENPVIEPKYQYCITLQLNTYETKESNKNTGRKWWEKTFTIRHQKITSKVQLRHGEIHRDGGGGGATVAGVVSGNMSLGAWLLIADERLHHKSVLKVADLVAVLHLPLVDA